MDAKRRSIAAVWPLLLLLLLAVWSGVSQAHVALTFPPARQPALDFLDSGRTPPPCGVPKGTTTLLHKNHHEQTKRTMSAILFSKKKRKKQELGGILFVLSPTRLRSADCQLIG